MDIGAMLAKYWEEIVALVDKIYFWIKDALAKEEEAAE